jgi:hypothetical protein
MTAGLTLRAAGAVLDPPRSDNPPTESDVDFQRDLVAPFGVKVDEDRFRHGAQVSHRELTDRLLDADDIARSRPQLVIVTHALPDVVPFTAVAPYLARKLDCDPLCFSVAQQGLAAPFTALRIAAAYHRSGRCAEAVITTLEQTTLPVALPLVDDTPLVDSAVAVVLGPGTGPRLTGTASGRSAADLIRDRARRDDLVVLGPWVDDAGLGACTTYRVAPGSYCTSVWLALAAHWRAWQDAHPAILLCDTDPRTGRSHVAVFETGRNRR